jgi:Toprim-like
MHERTPKIRAGAAVDELGRIKSEINLVEYAASRGYQLDRRRSSRYGAVMRHPVSADKVVISRSAVDGHWIYFSVRDGSDHGSIIDFVARRDRCSIGDAAAELRRWSGAERASIPAEGRHPTVARRIVDRARARAEYDRARSVTDSPYLNSRGIRSSTLRDGRFVGTFREDSRGRILFPHADSEFSGFESKHFGWTSFSTAGVKTLWSSNAFPTDFRLILVESAVDALSHYQLQPDERARYASVAGSMSPHQLSVIKDAFAALSPKTTIVLAFDRDAAGDKLAEQVQALTAIACERVTTEIGKDWNDWLKVRELEFISSLPRSRHPGLSL